MLSTQEAIARGYGFSYSSAIGGLVAAAASVNTVPMLWNPVGSGVDLEIDEVRLGLVSGAAVILSHLVYGLVMNAGADEGGAITSFTPGAAVGLRPGKGVGSQIRFAPATVVLAAAPAYYMTSGFSAPGALAAGALVPLRDRVDRRIVIPAGVAFFPYFSNAAMALTAAVTVIGLEIPRVAA